MSYEIRDPVQHQDHKIGIFGYRNNSLATGNRTRRNNQNVSMKIDSNQSTVSQMHVAHSHLLSKDINANPTSKNGKKGNSTVKRRSDTDTEMRITRSRSALINASSAVRPTNDIANIHSETKHTNAMPVTKGNRKCNSSKLKEHLISKIELVPIDYIDLTVSPKRKVRFKKTKVHHHQHTENEVEQIHHSAYVKQRDNVCVQNVMESSPNLENICNENEENINVKCLHSQIKEVHSGTDASTNSSNLDMIECETVIAVLKTAYLNVNKRINLKIESKCLINMTQCEEQHKKDVCFQNHFHSLMSNNLSSISSQKIELAAFHEESNLRIILNSEEPIIFVRLIDTMCTRRMFPSKKILLMLLQLILVKLMTYVFGLGFNNDIQTSIFILIFGVQ